MKNNIWKESDDRLYAAAVKAIAKFAKTNPSVQLRCFLFDCDAVRSGNIEISFDSAESNARAVKQLEAMAIEFRASNLVGDRSWTGARHQLTSPSVSPINIGSGDFDFPGFSNVAFPAWRRLAESGDYPTSLHYEDDYLDSNARLVMWRTAERLIAENAFGSLNLASPFAVGYSLHDEEAAILRLLNG